MDSVSVLSDVELQKELSLFANAQFTYDIAPGVAIRDESASAANAKPKKHDMHSLLNVKLASLAENNYHTSMSPDAIARFYDESPDCSPPNGYHSPNPSPPNGFYSPNPTPPNGIHLTNSANVGFQGIVNPPITFYGEDAIMGYDDEQFMETMRLLTNTSYSEPQLDTSKLAKATQAAATSPTATAAKKRNSISVKKSSPLVTKELSTFDSEDEEEDADESLSCSNKKSSPSQPLTKEDKRRRNTAASARFRVKKKMREQALQQTANEMTEKAKVFENRVHELEREVKWLKALIVEKKDGHLEQMLLQQYGSAASSSASSSSPYHHPMNHVGYNSMNHHLRR
ncbi:hypothetical protein [Parasitella parasitica]|uniref:BZIP domain-containing protein n=1 Tax=Parasitella parasitica TaxID=35722 RepID=A0A0B7NRS2_9FUNG|nr:hypothetical protein [Parasitella parasitica]